LRIGDEVVEVVKQIGLVVMAMDRTAIVAEQRGVVEASISN
jgi:hypothetical protein